MLEPKLELPDAFAPLLEPARFKVFYGGRGGAKSTAFANCLLLQGTQRPLRIMCGREVQNSIKESVHALLADRIKAMGLTDFYTVQEAQIFGRNGTRFFFVGLYRNPDSIKSAEGVDRCWVEEASTVSRDSWDKLLPTIRKPGSEIWVSYNPGLKTDAVHQIFHVEGRNGAIVRKVSWRDNPWMTQEMLDEMEDLKRADYAKYLHVWEGEFKSYADGAVYARQLALAHEEGRICRVPVQSATAVNTFWDLGKSDATAIWFHQRVGPDDRFIDYLEVTGQDIDEIATAVRQRGYNLGTHYMPHDVEHEILGFGNRTRKKMFEDARIKPIVVVPRIRHIHEGIEMVRAAFSAYWFDEQKCERGLECLKNYAYEYSQRRGDLNPEPSHNWACFTGETEILTRYGMRQMISLPENGEVMTLCGWKPYRNAGLTRKDAPLVEVVFASGYTVRCTPDHKFLTGSGWKSAESLQKGTVILSCWTRSRNTLAGGFIGSGPKKLITHAAERSCTGRHGSRRLGRYLAGAIFITEMAIRPITLLATWSACQLRSICHAEPESAISASGCVLITGKSQATRFLPNQREKRPQNGTDQRRGASGISGTRSGRRRGKNGLGWSVIASIAVSHLARFKELMDIHKSTAHDHARPPRIESVRPLSTRADVYCLTVDDGHNFALANGAIVHNCHAADALRQHAQGYRARDPWKQQNSEVSDRRRRAASRWSAGDSASNWIV